MKPRAGGRPAEAAEAARAGLREFKRQRIIVEAGRLFFEFGYQGSTLEELARRLDVTKPALYAHFRSKMELLSAICEAGIVDSLAALDRGIAGEATPARQLQAVVTGVAHTVIRLQDCVVVYQREMKYLDRKDAQRILRQRHHFDRRIADLLQRGVACREFRIEDTSMASVWIGGLLSWIPVWYMPGGRRSAAEVVENLVTTVMTLAGARVQTLTRDYATDVPAEAAAEVT